MADRIGCLNIKRAYPAVREQAATRTEQLEEMIDLGDAVVERVEVNLTHWVLSDIGAVYLVEAEEVGGAGNLLDVHSVSHNHCSVGTSSVGGGAQMRMVHHARACGLLQEALDWIGVVNLTEREEALAHDLQLRIARLLAEVRECTE